VMEGGERGPVELHVRAELEALGWSPLTPPGVLNTTALRAVHVAAVYDRCENPGYLPALDRQLARVLDEARVSVQADTTGLSDDDDADEVVDFEQRRKRRRPPAG
jgi:hypothetical protein